MMVLMDYDLCCFDRFIHIYLWKIHLFIAILYIVQTLGWSLKQEGVYVTSRSCEHMLLTYSLRTLACKWSGFSIWFMFAYGFLWWYWWIMMLCYLISMYWQMLLTSSPEFAWHLIDWACWWHQWTSLDSGLSQGVDCIGLSI